ncbi:MAG TPA: choice-of-anchor D domain-containing protein, partial [Polyangiaceae bacterium]|nr:choice-of-anchor D domain-containing protein [Polyangiaceae bacterium]
PALSITPDPGNTFAPTTVTKTSAPVTFTVKNSGQTATTALQAPAFSGGNSGDFSVLAGSDMCTGATLAANGGTCSFQLTVTPSVVGTVSTTLAVKDGSGDGATDPLSASSLSATALSLSPNPGNTFQNTAQGQTSPAVLFTLTNTGQTKSGAINAPTFVGGNASDFALVTASDNCAGAMLAQNATCTFQVTFSPMTSTTETTTLHVSDAAGASAADTLTATGFTPVAQLQVTPSPFSFPDTLGGAGNQSSKAFTIKNVGTGPTTAVNVQGIASPFAQSNNCPAALGVGLTCTMTVTFTPPGFGPYGNTISIVDTASDTVTLPVSGNGVSSSWYLIVSPSPGAFGMVALGSPKTLNFTATNYGQTALPVGISNVYFTGNYSGLFSASLTAGATPCNGAVLGELQSCTFTMTMTAPAGVGSGTVTGTSANINGQTYIYATVPVTGSY